MTDKSKREYVKRTQKDYSMTFKLQVVEETERSEVSIYAAKRKQGIQGGHTITTWLRKYGNLDW